MKPFPDSWSGEPDAEAGYPTRRRNWQASLSKWVLILLTITGGLAFAAKAIPSCAALMPGSVTIQAATAHGLAAVADPDEKIWWFWVAKQAEHFGPPISEQGNEAEKCHSFKIGVDIVSVTWYSSQGTGHFPGSTFELQTFTERDCTPSQGDKNFTNDVVDAPVKFLSWKVIELIKGD